MNQTNEITPQSSVAEQGAKVRQELHLATEYWLQIQPFIKDRPLRDTELFVATDAHRLLRQAAGSAAKWNSTDYGHRFPVPTEALPDLGRDPFREPEELCRDENLKPAILAAIAAPLMQKRTAKLAPIEVVGVAHEVLLAAERYINALPERKRGTDRLVADVGMAFSTVTFAEIEASDMEGSGQLPLLPPVGQKKKGRAKQELAEKPLSKTAIKNAVKQFLREHTPRMSQEKYEREQEQNDRLAKAGMLFRAGIAMPLSYQEWQQRNQEAIDDCLKNDRISLQALCLMRWERFKKSRQVQQRRAVSREAKKVAGKESKPELTKSAASSPTTAGQRKK